MTSNIQNQQNAKVSELSGAALDWVVAKCEERGRMRNPMGPMGGHGWWIWEETPSGQGGIILGKSVYMQIGPRIKPKTRNSGEVYSPSTDWAQGGPIIERELIDINAKFNSGSSIVPKGQWYWQASTVNEDDVAYWFDGPTPLIAAMRCYVASKLGNDVYIPSELLGR